MRFVSESEQEAIIEIYGTIGGWDWETWKPINTIEILSKELNRLKALNTKQITVKINSYGGDCNDALAIHDALQDHSAKIITQGNGYVASAATIIFMAGEERKISKNALFLIHKCSSYNRGNENDFEIELEAQKTTNETMLNVYEQKSKKSREEIKALMEENTGHGKWITADEAIAYGFATEIYNDNTSAKIALIDKRSMAAYNLPPMPEGYEAEEPETGLLSKIMQEMRDFFSQQNKPITNQSNPEMKKLSAVFPLLFALIAFKTDPDYEPAKGHLVTDEELKALEAKIEENNKTTAEAEAKNKKLAEDLTAMTTQRDELQTKLAAVPNPQSSANPTGGDTDMKSDFEKYQENDPFYKSLKS